MRATRPAVAGLELESVARGIVCLDQMVKRAEVEVVAARTLSPGRYLIVISGDVADVEEAMAAALAVAKEDKVDDVILRDPAPDLRYGLAKLLEHPLGEALLIVETHTVCASLLAAERALKDADVQLLELRLGAGLSGKGVFTLTGALHMIEAAEGAIRAGLPVERLRSIERIAQPHPDLPIGLLEAEDVIVRGRRSR